MSCSFISKNNVKCHHKALNKSKFCYLKSHHLNESEYKKAIFNMKSSWSKETYNVELFKKHNVSEDGWCFFNSIGMSLLHIYNKTITEKTITEKIKSFFEQKDFAPFNWESHTFKEKLKYKLLIISKNWLLQNLNEIHTETKETICDFIKSTYDIEDINEYFLIDDIDIKEDLPHKYWGGSCEQYAISKYFDVNIIIFLPTMYSFSKQEKEYKIMLSKVVRKNVSRYKISNCCFNNIILNNSMVLQVLNTSNDDEIPLKLYWDTLPENLKEKTQIEFNNTIFLLLFVSENSKDEDNTSHYNYLLYDDIGI
jgi:hypothetical protein